MNGANAARTSAEALFWSIHLVLLVLQPKGARRRYVGSVLVGVTTMAAPLAFWLVTRDSPTAIFGLSLSISGTWAYYTTASTRYELARLEAERDALADRVAKRMTQEEHMRIARELHDGIGASLTALLWRVRRIRREAQPEMTDDLDELVRRAQSGLGELRSATWALQAGSRPWPELADYARQRVAEVLTAVEVVDVSTDAARQRELPARLGLAAIRTIDTAMRGLRGSPSRIELALDEAGTIRISIDAPGRHEDLVDRMTARLDGLGATLRVEPERASAGRLLVSVSLA